MQSGSGTGFYCGTSVFPFHYNFADFIFPSLFQYCFYQKDEWTMSGDPQTKL